jgi:opacity protein-like surface antigen
MKRRILIVFLGILVSGVLYARGGAKVGGSALMVLDPGIGVVNNGNVIPLFNLSGNLTFLKKRGYELGVELSFDYGDSSAETFDLNTRFSIYRITFGVRASRLFLPWFEPYIGAGIGAVRGKLKLNSPDVKADDSASTLSGYILGGVEFWIPREILWKRKEKKDITFGLSLEGGYFFASNFGFSPRPPEPKDEELKKHQLFLQGSPLGTIDLSGAQIRIGVAVKF